MINPRLINGALSLLLILLLVDFTDRALLYHPLEAAATDAQDTATPEEGPAYERAWGPEIVSQNLFSQRRKGSASRARNAGGTAANRRARPETQPQRAQVRPDIRLSGIIKNQFGEYIAYIQIENKPPVGVRKGETIDGLKIVDIQQRSVALIWNNSPIDLSLASKPLIKR